MLDKDNQDQELDYITRSDDSYVVDQVLHILLSVLNDDVVVVSVKDNQFKPLESVIGVSNEELLESKREEILQEVQKLRSDDFVSCMVLEKQLKGLKAELEGLARGQAKSE